MAQRTTLRTLICDLDDFPELLILLLQCLRIFACEDDHRIVVVRHQSFHRLVKSLSSEEARRLPEVLLSLRQIRRCSRRHAYCTQICLFSRCACSLPEQDFRLSKTRWASAYGGNESAMVIPKDYVQSELEICAEPCLQRVSLELRRVFPVSYQSMLDELVENYQKSGLEYARFAHAGEHADFSQLCSSYEGRIYRLRGLP